MAYYLKVNDVFYYLDSTTSVSLSYPAMLTSNPLYNNKEASDSYITMPPTLDISGIVTDIKGYGAQSNLRSSDFLDGLLRAMSVGIPITVKYRLDKAEDYGWFITSMKPSQDTTNGFSGVRADGSIVQSFKISLTLEKPLVTSSLVVDTNPKGIYRAALQANSKTAQGVKDFDEQSADETRLQYLQRMQAQVKDRNNP